MSIVINKEKCAGCGQCSIVCPGSLLRWGQIRKHILSMQRTAGDGNVVTRNLSFKRWHIIIEHKVWEVR